MYKVALFQLKDGSSPVKDFIYSSRKSLIAKIERQLKYLGEFGLTRENPNLKKITGTNLWEVRILGKDSVRIICVAIIKNEVMVIHIFKKKSNKLPLKDLRIALKRYKILTFDI